MNTIYESDFIENKNIAIIGLGLIGASIALAIKDNCNSLIGVDNNPEISRKAEKLGIFNQVIDDPYKLSSNIDLLILAIPVEAILDLLKSSDKLQCKNAILMDVGSSKKEIMEAMDKMPSNFEAIGGHPICGKEKLSIDNADPNLFIDTNFVLCKLKRTSQSTIDLSLHLLKLLKANPLWMTAEEHDLMIAYTSHMPYLISSALALSTPKNSSELISTGYKSTARLAATPSSMMLNVLTSNRENVISALKDFHENIEDLISILNKNDTAKLESTLVKCSSRHKILISD